MRVGFDDKMTSRRTLPLLGHYLRLSNGGRSITKIMAKKSGTSKRNFELKFGIRINQLSKVTKRKKKKKKEKKRPIGIGLSSTLIIYK